MLQLSMQRLLLLRQDHPELITVDYAKIARLIRRLTHPLPARIQAALVFDNQIERSGFRQFEWGDGHVR